MGQPTNHTSNIQSNGTCRSRKQIKSQVPVGLFVFFLIVVLGLWIVKISPTLGFYWVTGIAFGFVLQRSRFCFVAALRDPYLIGGTELTKALLIALTLTTIGFTGIKYWALLQGKGIPGESLVAPIGLATIIGSVLFGVGMVLAGGCASGTLMRTGEGFQMQTVALFFFIIGSLWGQKDLPWWEENFVASKKGIFLPDLFGWLGALLLQLLLIALLYGFAHKWAMGHQE